MSLGATASAPASTWLTAVRASSSSVSSFCDLDPVRAVPEDAAVAVRGVLAEADVGDEHELGLLGPERAQGPLDDPVVGPGARALLVLLLRDPEQEHGLDPERDELVGLARRASSTEWRVDAPAAPRCATVARPDEERHHEVVELEPRLADERAQRVGAPQPAQARGGEGAHAEQVTSARGRDSGGQPGDHEPRQRAVAERQPHEPRRLARERRPGIEVEERRGEEPRPVRRRGRRR